MASTCVVMWVEYLLSLPHILHRWRTFPSPPIILSIWLATKTETKVLKFLNIKHKITYWGLSWVVNVHQLFRVTVSPCAFLTCALSVSLAEDVCWQCWQGYSTPTRWFISMWFCRDCLCLVSYTLWQNEHWRDVQPRGRSWNGPCSGRTRIMKESTWESRSVSGRTLTETCRPIKS